MEALQKAYCKEQALPKRSRLHALHGFVDHGWIRQSSRAVYHGGMGTMLAALGTGLPPLSSLVGCIYSCMFATERDANVLQGSGRRCGRPVMRSQLVWRKLGCNQFMALWTMPCRCSVAA